MVTQLIRVKVTRWLLARGLTWARVPPGPAPHSAHRDRTGRCPAQLGDASSRSQAVPGVGRVLGRAPGGLVPCDTSDWVTGPAVGLRTRRLRSHGGRPAAASWARSAWRHGGRALVAGPGRDQGGPHEEDPVRHQGAEPGPPGRRDLAAALSACVLRSCDEPARPPSWCYCLRPQQGPRPAAPGPHTPTQLPSDARRSRPSGVSPVPARGPTSGPGASQPSACLGRT